MSKLVVVEGPLRGKTFEIAGPASLGREETCTVRLEGRHVSRVHARLERRGDAFWILDQGSRNGIFVNGQAVREAALRPDDQIEIGEYLLVFDPTKDPEKLPRLAATVVETLEKPFPFPPEGDPRLPRLAEAAAALAAAEDPGEAARRLLEALTAALPDAERAVVSVLDSEGRLKAAARKAPRGAEEFYLPTAVHHEIVRRRRAVIATDAARRPGAGKKVGLLGVPLASGDRLAGLACLEAGIPEGQDRPPFRPADLRLAAALGALAGIRLDQIRRQGSRSDVGSRPLPALLAAFEKDCLVEALRRASGDLEGAARILQIPRADLDARIQACGLAAPPPPPPSWKSVEP